MKALIFFLTLLINFLCYGQSKVKTYQLKEISDTYVVDLKIGKNVFSEDCGCMSSKKHKQCNLYEGLINLIRFIPDEVTLFDSVSLRKVKFFVLDSSQHLKPDSIYTVTLSPGSSISYLRISSILRIDRNEKYKFVHNEPYLSGLINCYKIGFFNKLFLKFKIIRPEQINYNNKHKEKDRFDEFISHRYSKK